MVAAVVAASPVGPDLCTVHLAVSYTSYIYDIPIVECTQGNHSFTPANGHNCFRRFDVPTDTMHSLMKLSVGTSKHLKQL